MASPLGAGNERAVQTSPAHGTIRRVQLYVLVSAFSLNEDTGTRQWNSGFSLGVQGPEFERLI